MTIKTLTIECTRVANISPFISQQGDPVVVALLEDVKVYELMLMLKHKLKVKGILDELGDEEIALYMKPERDNREDITVTVGGVDNVFTGDELTSPIHQAEAFINKLSKAERLF